MGHDGSGLRVWSSAAICLVAVVVLVVAGTGCGSGTTGNPVFSCKAGEYYDFLEAHRCVAPTKNLEQKYTLYLYWLEHRLAVTEKNRPITHQVNFKQYFTKDELNAFLADPRIKWIEFVSFETPGGHYNHQLSATSTKDRAVDDAVAEELAQARTWERPDALQQAETKYLEDSNIKIVLVRVVATPLNILAFWEDHTDRVRFVQPMPSDTWYSQTGYNPDQKVTP